MAEKRERLDVIYDILQGIINNNNHIGPTRLIQKSNLSPIMFKEYTQHLIDNQLIVSIHHNGRTFYQVREKGFQFIEQYQVFKHFIREIGI